MAIPIAAVMAGAMGGMGITGMFPPLTRAMQYGMNRVIPNEIVGTPEAIEAWYRGIISRDQLSFEARSTGIKEERQEWLIKLRQQLFGVIEAIVLWRREEITEEDLLSRLYKVGIPEDDTDLWVKFTETRPGVQDIIRFAVREVYSPQIAETYGLFEGTEEVAETAKPDLKAAGIRPEDLGKYWAAHWDLPSVQMGFEMLHRGIITLEDLQLLMRTLDIMPYWRDKIIDISYNPLTRVDVRRMHKIGVLTNEEVLEAYKHIGYNDENAQRMLDFTMLYNADPIDVEKTGTDKERDLTKADILRGYGDGLFTEQEAGEALMMLGYSQDEVEYYFSRIAFELERDNTNAYIRAYRTAYIGNTMSQNEVTDALGKLNLTGKRVENLFNIWNIEKAVRTVKPTKAEILMFLRKKIIDQGTAISELLGMGYAQRYVDMYLQTV